MKTLHITIKTPREALQNFARAYELAKQRKLKPHFELAFENLATLRKSITDKRLNLLHAIKQFKPDSIYALGKKMNRDLKSIHTDLAILKELGLVALEKTNDARRTLRPRVLYDTVRVDITI